MNHLKIGDFGEEVAAQFLLRTGYKILNRKFRTKTGEIDIIAQQNGTIIFVEVKTRRSAVFGSPAEAVTYTKQQKIIKTALCYLNMTQKVNSPCRFDVLEVFIKPDKTFECNHIVAAFGN